MGEQVSRGSCSPETCMAVCFTVFVTHVDTLFTLGFYEHRIHTLVSLCAFLFPHALNGTFRFLVKR